MRSLPGVIACLAAASMVRAGTPVNPPAPEAVDTAAIARIIDEGMNRSQ
ncbi:MAG: hypothetical protein H6Q29_642, partial [Bacteroidetes bacterium]|nr:hypothetical protein [Bacteroidota bacterium]